MMDEHVMASTTISIRGTETLRQIENKQESTGCEGIQP